MASQRITIMKIGGAAADVALEQFQEWSAARESTNPTLWSPEQWPSQIRGRADVFADQLRSHAFTIPVVHFVEWADRWSMGDLFPRWLTPPDGPMPLIIHADQYEMFAYSLPDGERLAQYLASAGPQQWPETDWYIARLREAVDAWQKLVERTVLVVLRHVIGASWFDEEITASLSQTPGWLLTCGLRG